jgi:hypothetical protein
VPGMQFNVAAQAELVNASVEMCSTQCTYMESFVCRSFDFLVDKRTCLMYKENLKDKVHADLQLVENKNCNHYSSKK